MVWFLLCALRRDYDGMTSCCLLGDRRAAREPGDAEDDELGRLDRRDADLDDELARVDDLVRVVLRVALHVERLAGRRPEQGAVPPDAHEEGVERSLHALPEVEVVG